MANDLPLRLLGYENGALYVFDPRSHGVYDFDIISYTWGDGVAPYNCGISGVTWEVKINPQKLEDIKRLMAEAGVRYLWADCVCINQGDDREKSAEIAKMYQYYKRATTCYILIDMPEMWDPQEIVGNLKFIDHIRSHMVGAALASETTRLTENLTNRLAMWANKKWTFGVDLTTVKSTGIDIGLLNCYSTSINHVRSLFDQLYFYRVWTFQEMILGKNITLWSINPDVISRIGELHIWMDLATEAKDKAQKLEDWIESDRFWNTQAVNAVLRVLEEDLLTLTWLQTQVLGISSARTDIINGGPLWWKENYKGVSNIFSAISITPRSCKEKADIFRGLLGVFSGLFTPEEIETEMLGNDMETISFNFFKQLSIKTDYAWTKLAISSRERGQWDWIPVVENYSGLMTTDCFAGVVNLGRLNKKGQAKATAMTGIKGTPRKYMQIMLREDQERHFHFKFKGCNCGKDVKIGTFSSEPIPTNDQAWNVAKDETGKILVQCATILGSLMDPGGDVIAYRRRLLGQLQPNWTPSDPIAKPKGWIDRCVSGTPWENPMLRVHNQSINCRMPEIRGCESRLANESTASISCEVRVNCGCTITAPFSLVFEAMTAVEGSFLGEASISRDHDNRITLKDGLGLVQVGDIGRTFNLVAFGGDVNAHKSYASSCRSTKKDKPVVPKLPWPSGRVLVRDEFVHDITHMTRNYGYVGTGGCGNLLICRNHPLDQYKIIGVCIDENIEHEKESTVTIR